MTRAEFLAQLRAALSDFPDEEREDALNFYEEYFNEAGPSNEGVVLAELGSPAKVARIIRANCPTGERRASKGPLARAAAALTLDGPDWRAPAAPVPPRQKPPEGENAGGGEDGQSVPTPVYARREAYSYGGAGGEGGAGGGTGGAGGDNRILWLILIIATCPLWIGAVFVMFGLAVGLVGGLCGIAFGGIATMIAGFAALGGGVGLLFHSIGSGILMMGLSLLCVAVGAAMTSLTVWAVKKFAPIVFGLCARVCRAVFRSFRKAGE